MMLSFQELCFWPPPSTLVLCKIPLQLDLHPSSPSIGCLHISASAEQKSAVHVGLVVSAQGCIFFLYPSSLLVQRCLFRVSKTPLSTRFACSWVPLYSRQSYIPGWIHLGPSDVFTPRRIHFGSCAARFAREPSACRRWASRWCRHLFLLPVCWSIPLQLYMNLHYMGV